MEQKHAETKDANKKEGVIDIGKLKEDETPMTMLNTEENREYYGGIKMALDYDNELFLSTGGMLFTNIELDMDQNGDITMHSKITNGTFCVLHGNGPGVILWR